MKISTDKITLIKIFLVIFVVAAVVLHFTKYRWEEADITLAGVPLHVQVAQNNYQQQKGLGDRDTLAPYDGMLFLFPYPSRYAFVMRDMRFPIDIVWLSAGGVVDIAPNVPVEPGVSEAKLRRYMPRSEANVVIELPAGWAERHDLKIGDRLGVATSTP